MASGKKDPMMSEKPPALIPSGVNWSLPGVAKIEGILFQPAETPALAEVVMQYASSQSQRWCELRIPLDQALHLAGLLDRLRSDPRVVALTRGAKKR